MLELTDTDVYITRKLRKQMNMTDVSMQIEEIKVNGALDSYREACIEYLEQCKENIDFPELAKLLSPTLKQKMYQEAINDGFIRGTSGGSLDGFIDDQIPVQTQKS